MTLQDAQQAITVGTELYAIDPCVMTYDDKPALEIGEKYVVHTIHPNENMFAIKSKSSNEHWFDFINYTTYFSLTPPADPNPALTEALEAISWPVRYDEDTCFVMDSEGNSILEVHNGFLIDEEDKTKVGVWKLQDALGHLIAGMLNEVKRK